MKDIHCKTCGEKMEGIKDPTVREECLDCKEITDIIANAVEGLDE